MSAVCPVCERQQDAGLLCSACCDVLERELGDVAAIVGELDVTLSKQARIGTPGKSGLARERTPINVGAIDPRWVLENVLGTWARDVSGEKWQPKQAEVRVYRDPQCSVPGPFCPRCSHPSCAAMRVHEFRPAPPVMVQASAFFLSEISAIRRHPAVVELVDEIIDAIAQARRAVDRPADHVYLGQCLVPTPDEEGRDVTCIAEIYARPAARETTCKVCGVMHDVLERRKDLLDRAEDMLFTVQEVAQMLGSYGNLSIGESTIRGYISKGQLSYHGKVAGLSVVRLGDLMGVITTNASKPTRKLRRAV